MPASDWMFFIDPIMQLLGVGDFDAMTNSEQNTVIQMAQNALQDWQQKQAQEIGNVTTESAMTNLPNQSWLRENLYQKQSDLYTKFLSDYQKAAQQDSQSALQNPIVKFGADIANSVVNGLSFGQANNVVQDAYAKAANANQNRVLQKFNQDEKNLQQQQQALDKQVAQSWNKNQNAVKQIQAKGGITNV